MRDFRRKIFPVMMILVMVMAGLAVAPLQGTDAATKSACERYFTNHKQPFYAKKCRTVDMYGHRGRHYPAAVTNENTMRALRYDYKNNIGCETDTWALADDAGNTAKGIGVIIHDETLKRTVDPDTIAAAGLTPETKIEHVTLAQFKQLRTKGGDPLPTLKQWVTFAAKKKIPCNIEIKWAPSQTELRELGQIIRENNATKLVTFYGTPNANQSCNITGPTKILNDPELDDIIVGLKQGSGCVKTPDELATAGFSYVTLPQNWLNTVSTGRQLVKSYHAYGLKVGNNNSGGPLNWKADIRCGVDFIISSNPGDLKTWLRG